jgi:hypothetical protein
MLINDPVLGFDVSLWTPVIKTNELEDGGVKTVVVGIYSAIDSTGKKVLDPTSRAQLTAVAKSSMVLQAYYWDDITLTGESQMAWLQSTLKAEGFPIRWMWLDDEQWWTNWGSWMLAKQNQIPWSSVPYGSSFNISSHFGNTASILYKLTNQMGVYTNNGFVSSWASGMNSWLSLYPSWIPYYAHQPSQATILTWQQVKDQWMPTYDPGRAPGQIASFVYGHQFTGDVMLLPGAYGKYGAYSPADVNVFSAAFLNKIRNNPALFTGGVTPPPVVVPPVVVTPTIPSVKYHTVYPVNVRDSFLQSSTLLGIMETNTHILVDKDGGTAPNVYHHFLGKNQDPQGSVKFPNGGYVYAQYCHIDS